MKGAIPAEPRRWRSARIRVTVLAAALAALLSTYLVVSVSSADAAETLLSQGRPATASSVESSVTPASSAVDGDAGTRWSSAFSDPQWLQVDLGGSSTITRVALNWEGAYARAFNIQTSADGTTWRTIYSTAAGIGGAQDLAVTGVGRYVRLTATQRATQYGVSLWGFQVFGTGSSTLAYRQRGAGKAGDRVLRRVGGHCGDRGGRR